MTRAADSHNSKQQQQLLPHTPSTTITTTTTTTSIARTMIIATRRYYRLDLALQQCLLVITITMASASAITMFSIEKAHICQRFCLHPPRAAAPVSHPFLFAGPRAKDRSSVVAMVEEDFGELVASSVSSFTLHSADGERGESTLGESINFVGLPDLELEGGPKKRKEQAPQEATQDQEASQKAAQEEAPEEETKHGSMDSSAPKQSADGDKEAPQEATQEAHVKEEKNMTRWAPLRPNSQPMATFKKPSQKRPTPRHRQGVPSCAGVVGTACARSSNRCGSCQSGSHCNR